MNEAYKDFIELRQRLFKAITKSLEEDGCCKSSEGRFSIIEHWPDYFEQNDGAEKPTCEIQLYLYVIGPNRHYSWTGKNFLEAFKKCERDVSKWIKEYET